MAQGKNKAEIRETIAVVGKNLWAGSLLNDAVGQSAQWLWIPTELESKQIALGVPSWVVLPARALASLGDFAKTCVSPLSLSDAMFAWDGVRRVSIGALAKSSQDLPFARPIVEKILALGLFSDSTPDLFVNGLMDPLWTHKSPRSLAEKTLQNERSFVLVDRSKLLSLMDQAFQERGVKTWSHDAYVLGLEVDSKKATKSLLFNAPYASVSMNKVLWVSARTPVKEEAAERDRLLNPAKPCLEGYWAARGAWVPRERVAGLPIFSIWLESGRRESSAAKTFVETGAASSGALRRVLCVPDPTGSNQFWLQVETLKIVNEIFAEPVQALDASVDFLSELCPFLDPASLQWTEIQIEESSVLSGAQSQLADRGRGVWELAVSATNSLSPSADKHGLKWLTDG